MERLQKNIAARGYCSRRRAEELIAAGQVKVNGEVVTEMGRSFDDNVTISILGKELVKDNEKKYYIFHKPRMVVTTMYDPQGRKTVADFFRHEKIRLFPVGRLDYDVSGLLLMTNGGEFADYVTHPRYEIKKTYQALCKGRVATHQIKALLSGVIIDDDYKTKALDAGILKYNEEDDTTIIFLIITEGRKHHVKKMLIAADIYLIKLKRIAIETINVKDVPAGKYRAMTPHEVKSLYGVFARHRRK